MKDFLIQKVYAGSTINIPAALQDPSAAAKTNFGDFIVSVVSFSIIILGVIAVLMLMFAGFQMMTTDSFGKRSDAKKRIKEVLLGVGLALISYTVLYTINPDLVKIRVFSGNETPKDFPEFGRTVVGDSNVDEPKTPEDQASIDADRDTYSKDIVGKTEDGQTINGIPTLTSKIEGSETGIRNQLLEKGVGVNKSEQYTKVVGLRESTMLGIDSVKEVTGVDNFIITGGTESGHEPGIYSHAEGYKIDIGANSNSDKYSGMVSAIEQKARSQNPQVSVGEGSMYSYIDSNRNIKVNVYHEPDHLDLQIIPYKPIPAQYQQ